ncbi:MAG: hypothetical protein F4Z09_11020 [Rhodobacteraceae bacterium]|nr:hypothetical protein [Paracoccaceae bacterium]
MTSRCTPRFDLNRESINRLLDLRPPWEVVELEVVHEKQEVHVHIAHDGNERLSCPECGCKCSGSRKDQQVPGPAATTEKKGTTKIKQSRLKSMKPHAPFFWPKVVQF